jgi:hypothetical protein
MLPDTCHAAKAAECARGLSTKTPFVFLDLVSNTNTHDLIAIEDELHEELDLA